MKAQRKWIMLLGIIALCGVAHGYPTSHGPFQLGEVPPSVPLMNCAIAKEEYPAGNKADEPSGVYYTAPRDPNRATLKMERLISDSSWRISVLNGDGILISAAVTNFIPFSAYRVRSADLNHDSQPDFIVNISSGGCGLAAEESTTIFLLSSGGRYVAKDFYSFDFGPEDVVSFKEGAPCYFIHNDLIDNGDEKTKDGRDHNFWVYQLYRFSGSEMVEANGDDPRFPKWVWYTFKDNHSETDQLTTQQKRRLLKSHAAQDGAASGSQPIRAETNRTSSAAGSRR